MIFFLQNKLREKKMGDYMIASCTLRLTDVSNSAADELNNSILNTYDYFEYLKPYLNCNVYLQWIPELYNNLDDIAKFCKEWKCNAKGYILCYDSNGDCVQFTLHNRRVQKTYRKFRFMQVYGKEKNKYYA